MESTDVADSLRDSAELNLDKKVAIYIALLGGAFVDMLRGRRKLDEGFHAPEHPGVRHLGLLPGQEHAADELRVAAEALELKLGEQGLADAQRKQIEQKIAAYNAEINRLESDAKGGEGKKELIAKAKDFEKDRDAALRQDPYFDYAQAFLQIAVVLASASIVLKIQSLLIGSGFLSVFGALLMINGFTLAVSIPFIE